MSKVLDQIFFLGRPFSPLYSLAMKLREKLFAKSIFQQHTLPVPVISVGNLMLGGTGKTPTVLHIAKLLRGNGYHPAVVSRGYGGKAANPVNVVSDGKSILLSPESAGDEPYLLASSLPSTPVLTGKKRINPCKESIDQFKTDIIILDDGFQHLPVKRDLDIVLFNSTALAGNSRVFPGGPLREPVSAMKRCNAFLLTGTNDKNRERAEKFSRLLTKRFPDKPVYFSFNKGAKLVLPDDVPWETPTPERIYGFCGIANPGRFEESLSSLQLEIKGIENFKDHSSYSQKTVSALCQKAIELGADCLVTTRKDQVKLQQFECSLPLFILEIENTPETSFNEYLLNCLKT